MKAKLAAVTALAAALIALNAHFPLRELVPALIAWLQGLGAWSVLPFTALFILCALFFIPVGPLLIVAAAVYGFKLGYAVSMASGLAGVALAHALGRRLWREKVEKLRLGNPRFESVCEAVSRKGPLLVFLIRLNPFLPFSLLNYLFTIPKLDFRKYMLASMLGMTPDFCLYLYAGKVGRGLMDGSAGFTVWNGLILGMALAATVAAGLIINGLIRKSSQKPAQAAA